MLLGAAFALAGGSKNQKMIPLLLQTISDRLCLVICFLVRTRDKYLFEPFTIFGRYGITVANYKRGSVATADIVVRCTVTTNYKACLLQQSDRKRMRRILAIGQNNCFNG